MSARTIWVVMGSTGEYSDRSEWLVAAYEDEGKAKRHADLATERAYKFNRAECEHGEKMRQHCYECGRDGGYDSPELRAALGGLDPRVSMDYTGTDYVALPVPALDEVPAEPRP